MRALLAPACLTTVLLGASAALAAAPSAAPGGTGGWNGPMPPAATTADDHVVNRPGYVDEDWNRFGRYEYQRGYEAGLQAAEAGGEKGAMGQTRQWGDLAGMAGRGDASSSEGTGPLSGYQPTRTGLKHALDDLGKLRQAVQQHDEQQALHALDKAESDLGYDERPNVQQALNRIDEALNANDVDSARQALEQVRQALAAQQQHLDARGEMPGRGPGEGQAQHG